MSSKSSTSSKERVYEIYTSVQYVPMHDVPTKLSIPAAGQKDRRLWGRELDPANRAEKRKWLRHCPAASNVGSSARSFKMIGILREKKHLCLK